MPLALPMITPPVVAGRDCAVNWYARPSSNRDEALAATGARSRRATGRRSGDDRGRRQRGSMVLVECWLIRRSPPPPPQAARAKTEGCGSVFSKDFITALPVWWASDDGRLLLGFVSSYKMPGRSACAVSDWASKRDLPLFDTTQPDSLGLKTAKAKPLDSCRAIPEGHPTLL